MLPLNGGYVSCSLYAEQIVEIAVGGSALS